MNSRVRSVPAHGAYPERPEMTTVFWCMERRMLLLRKGAYGVGDPWNFGENDAFGFAIYEEARKSGGGKGTGRRPGCGAVIGIFVAFVALCLLAAG
jgi:hypothetical protein